MECLQISSHFLHTVLHIGRFHTRDGFAASNLIHLVKFAKCWQIFVELNSKGVYSSSGKEEESRCVLFTPPQNVKVGCFTS